MLKQPKRIQEKDYPQTIQKLGNGTYYYNYDIREIQVEVTDQDNNTKIETQYDFIQVLLYGQPSYKDCVKAIIRSFLTIDEEFDLINSYNSCSVNLIDNSDIVDQYRDYLNTLSEIKAKVKEDFARL